jgi:hypothetical protein
MTRSRLRLKALGACALAFSLMAVWAGAAQAESTGGSWTYETGGVLKTFEGALAEPEGNVEIDSEIILHSEGLEGTKILYHCIAVVAISLRYKPNAVIVFRLIFSGCVALLNGVQSLACKPKEGKITTNLVKAQALLHKLAGGSIDKILIAEGQTEAGGAANLATIESTASCALGIKVPVGGKIALEPSNPTTHEVKHLMREFSPLTHIWLLSDTAEHKANILGSLWIFLIGAHSGLKWAGLWL